MITRLDLMLSARNKIGLILLFRSFSLFFEKKST